MRIFGHNFGQGKAADYYRSPAGSEEHRAAYREMRAAADGVGFADPDADLSYEIDNADELAAERYYEEQEEHYAQRHPASMERQPYTWHGVDRDGNAKSGETIMRGKTVPAMVQGFWDADYRQLQITRDGTGIVGGITPDKGFSGACRRSWWRPVSTQKQREP